MYHGVSNKVLQYGIRENVMSGFRAMYYSVHARSVLPGQTN